MVEHLQNANDFENDPHLAYAHKIVRLTFREQNTDKQ